MIAEQLAVLIYGALTMVVALVLAVVAGSQLALVLLFLAAGAAYVFQALNLLDDPRPKMWVLAVFWVGSIALSCASVAVSFWG